MANIPSHMRVQSSAAIMPRTRRTPMSVSILVGVMIGLSMALVGVLAGLVH